MAKEFTQEDKDRMDANAVLAEQELSQALVDDQLLAPGIDYIINWHQRWYIKAGHKRLGRMLVGMAKEQKE